MTRFWITLDQGVEFVLTCLGTMGGGEIFVPKIPSMRLVDLAKAIGPECRLEGVGIRNGEKLHEVMITEDDSRHTVELSDHYVIDPGFWFERKKDWRPAGRPCADGFRYASDTNTAWLTRDDLMGMILHLDLPEAAEYASERKLRV
jgi:UDP-N-acetylglucosamine 4,6-dehydratase